VERIPYSAREQAVIACRAVEKFFPAGPGRRMDEREAIIEQAHKRSPVRDPAQAAAHRRAAAGS
jgi:hypothetical protein